MHNSQTKEARFAQARAEKRQIFQENWNSFLKQPALRISLLAYLASRLVIFLVSGMTIRDIAFEIQILHEGYPAWCNFVIFGLQLLLAVPGAVMCLGLLRVLRRGSWPAEGKPDTKGCTMLRAGNIIVCVLSAVALAIYPGVIIVTGEYLPEGAARAVFDLYVVVTILLLNGLIFVRPVLRHLEENITCCWSDYGFLLPLMLLLPFVAVGVRASLPESWGLWIGCGAMVLSMEMLMALYYGFLRKTYAAHEEINDALAAQLQDPYDPYNNHN